ncbi:Ion transport protein [Rhizoctonia solani]|uniref:Calcium-channel protein CCH1 n=1 Tax=Rhizoctonia solani TaxID=456999 RepID=A0A8H7ID69_9AGAM|nr:Ion transport protein [Rhizoctonia solani]
MAPPRTPTRDRSPQRIDTGVAAVSNSVQPSPVGPRTSPEEGLSRRTSWNRAVNDPLGLYASRHDSLPGHHDAESIFDEPESVHPYFSRQSIQSEVSCCAPHWRGDSAEDEGQSAAWGAVPSTSRRSPASPMRSATLKAVSKHLRRVSLRVVNLAGVQLEDKPMPRTPEREDVPRPFPDREQGEPISEPVPPPEPEDELDRSQHMQLRGRTLGMFGPENGLRKAMRATLLWPDRTNHSRPYFRKRGILTTQAWRSVYVHERVDGYFKTWEDYGLFVLFAFSHPEIKPSSVGQWLRDLAPGDNFAARARSVRRKVFEQRAPYAQHAVSDSTTALSEKSPKATLTFALASQVGVASAHASRSDTTARPGQPHPQHIQSQSGTCRAARICALVEPDRLCGRVLVLDHVWLAISGKENQPNMHLYVFRALSVLRTARLLAVTKGTSTIMHSLKRAGPLLTRVTSLFFSQSFSFVGSPRRSAALTPVLIRYIRIVGVQSFKGSFRRTCVVADSIADIGGENSIALSQNCGAWIDPATLLPAGYVDSDGNRTNEAKDSHALWARSASRLRSEPAKRHPGFDNFFLASMQVVIVASVNTWAPVMYQMMDTDFYFSFAFFIVCVLVLNFWLINLFVAVITNMFGAIRTETKKSAFAQIKLTKRKKKRRVGRQGETQKGAKFYSQVLRMASCYLFLGGLIVVSFGLQASKTTDSSPEYLDKLGEGFVFGLCSSIPSSFRMICQTKLSSFLTIAFDVDIIWRALGYLPQWRDFFMKKNNNLDLVLAIGSSIIQIPAIKHSEVYPWLTIFQLARFYRWSSVLTRTATASCVWNMTGLANMVLFLILTNYIAALVAIQLLRGDLPEDTDMNYSQIPLSFIGMYQIFSSENWTDVLYNATASEVQFKQTIIVAIFLCGWFFFANFILLQMFIAVINENFDVAEEQKREEQLAAYQRKIQPRVARLEWMEKWNPYRFFKSESTSTATGGSGVNRNKSMLQRIRRSRTHARKASYHSDFDEPKGFIAILRKFFALDPPESEDVPMQNIRKRRPTLTILGDETVELERHLEILSATNPNDIPDDRRFEREQRSRKAEFIRAHPTFDKTFWILSQQNPLRRFCQMLVTPSNGDRIYGRPPSPVPQAIFQLVIMLVVISGIAIAAVATPVYRREYFRDRGGRVHLAWFDIAEATFGLILVLELVIKVVADGFIFTPNAYVLSVWNLVDLAILAALLSNVITSLVIIGGISRLTRSLKAFRALRLITLVGRMRETFHSVMFAGANRIFEAGMLAMLYMLPYACWGLNIFAGRFYLCNDEDASGKAECVGEYMSSPVDDSLGFLAPRSWDIPSPSTTFSFDTFGSSLLILFEIVSLEGWIDVLVVALGLKGKDEQPGHNVAQVNSIFFMVYNLMGAVVILTLFVSIIIGNFSSRSGMALLTTEQRQWIDLQKLIKRQRPAKRPKVRPQGVFREWCYDRAVRKHGFWARFMTVFYVFHILVLMSQTFSNSILDNFFRNAVFLFLALIYALDIFIRLSGLGWRSFKGNGWNLFDIVVVIGNFATGIPIVFGSQGFLIEQLQKLFLVSIAFKLVQKSDNLNQLFKTAVASLPAIMNLFLLWFTLFIFYGIIFMEVFGLTRWGGAETHNQNYSSLGNALLMLAFMSTGEGWNEYMHDYTVEYPRCQNSSPIEPDSDCGSAAWAYFLFISWNILSMYIFVNMFTGVVVENFSYVFQLTGEMSISREEMRAFKKVWAEFDPDRTGFISRRSLVPFFSKLRGIFEVRLYPESLSPQALVKATKMNNPLAYRSTITGEEIPVPLNMRRLNSMLNGVDYAEVRARRQTYNRLFYEARILEEDPGISFTNMLLLLAHHKLIDDSKALRVEEAYRRKITTDHVTELVNLDRAREKLEAERRVKSGVPAIVVEDLPSSPPPTTSRDIAGGLSSPINSPRQSFERHSNHDHTGYFGRIGSAPNSPITSTPIPGHQRQISDASMLSADITSSPTVAPRYSQDQSASVSRRPSVWGDIIQAAGEKKDEEPSIRRSNSQSTL